MPQISAREFERQPLRVHGFLAGVPLHDVWAAQKQLWNVARVVAEPGGAAALAALTSGRYKAKNDERVGVLVCGSNTKQCHFRADKNADRKMHLPRPLPSHNYERKSMSVYERVNPLGIALLSPPKPVGAFVPFVRSGYLLFLSGHFAKRDGQPWKGQLGSDMTLAEGKAAARAAAIDVLGSLQSATGDLNEVIRIVKLLVLVNSSSTFTEHHLVANGASDLLVEVFGERGAHTRSAFAVAQIPFGSCVEVELVVEVASSVFRYRR